MADRSLKPIEEVRVGEYVLSFDEDTGEQMPGEVLELEAPVRDHMCEIAFLDGSSLRLTNEHPLFTTGGWKAIDPKKTAEENPALGAITGRFETGDALRMHDGTVKTIARIGCWSERIQTYNLKDVGSSNTFYVGSILAHNATVVGECINGYRRCAGLSLEICKNGKWVKESCGYGGGCVTCPDGRSGCASPGQDVCSGEGGSENGGNSGGGAGTTTKGGGDEGDGSGGGGSAGGGGSGGSGGNGGNSSGGWWSLGSSSSSRRSSSSSTSAGSQSSSLSSFSSSVSSVSSTSSVSSSMSSLPFCGNGVLNVGEQCDDGNLWDGDGCDRFCRLATSHVCGNNRLEYPEECDDGNLLSGDGCSLTCRLERTLGSSSSSFFSSGTFVCGNALLESGEECDDGNRIVGDGCSASCRLEIAQGQSVCGNGVQEASEQCDDGNKIVGDGCDLHCRFESSVITGTNNCGNSVLDVVEECDDGNLRDFDGCSATCFLEGGSCGDGIVQQALGEQCEPSIPLDPDQPVPFECGPDCRFTLRFCGNGVLNLGEQCDAGVQNSDAPDALCRLDCSWPRCGDNIVDSGEQCDDGNGMNGDGCDRFCLREGGAAGLCGNGRVEEGEECDDGNLTIGDGCNAACVVEANWLCTGSPSICCYTGPTFCGDGIRGCEEECDDGNLLNGDGCSANCQLEVPGGGGSKVPQFAILRAYSLGSSSPSLPGQTGPAALAIMAAGAAAGFSWIRRKRKP